VPWTFFANGLGQSSNSLVGNANLITKNLFSAADRAARFRVSGIVDFLLAFVMLLG